MDLFEFIYLTFFPFIPSGESLQISYSEMSKIFLFWCSLLGLNIIDIKMNQFSRKICMGEGEVHVGKFYLCLDAVYGSK